MHSAKRDYEGWWAAYVCDTMAHGRLMKRELITAYLKLVLPQREVR